jgi:competence protein ComGC
MMIAVFLIVSILLALLMVSLAKGNDDDILKCSCSGSVLRMPLSVL